MKQIPLGLLALSLPLTAPAFAAEEADESAFRLGTILVTGRRPQVGEIASEQVSSVVSREDMRRFDRTTVGEAVNLLSGVSVTTNVRNEQTIYLRGYDPRQTPLFVDGIPVYVPYDGYVDFARFGTSDLAGIQVAKGFSSVAYGPNTLGGAINLISRKPTKTFEGDATVGFGQSNMRRAEANIGTKQDKWYLQAGASRREADGFRMSSDFRPTATEDGGQRENSYYKDDKMSFKLGITPRGTDEYALSYIRQDGEKGQPPSTDPASARYWRWPFWNKESVYFVSRTGLGDHETLKLRLYTDKFDNEVDSYTNGTYTTPKTSGPGSVGTGRSIYHDRTFGGSAEIESRRVAGHTMRLVAQSRNDRHEERDANAVVGADFEDTLQSLSFEDGIELGDRTMLSVGFAHHELHPDKVYKSGTGPAYTLPGRQSANDPQIGLFHDVDPTMRFYATIADKTRLPTLKDRYSQRLGSYIENPGLVAEEARNFEVGYQGQPWPGAQAEAALFWNDIENKIQTVNLSGGVTCTNVNRCQMQNVGKARVRGAEFGLRTPLGRQWEVGGNATYMVPRNVSDPSVRLTGMPNTKVLLHALWHPVEEADLIAFAEHSSGRWSSSTVKVGAFTTLNVKAVWRPVKNLSAELGVNNITDRQYEVDFGFPNPGRMLFGNLSYRF